MSSPRQNYRRVRLIKLLQTLSGNDCKDFKMGILNKTINKGLMGQGSGLLPHSREAS